MLSRVGIGKRLSGHNDKSSSDRRDAIGVKEGVGKNKKGGGMRPKMISVMMIKLVTNLTVPFVYV